jgi:hypothetical protein
LKNHPAEAWWCPEGFGSCCFVAEKLKNHRLKPGGVAEVSG